MENNKSKPHVDKEALKHSRETKTKALKKDKIVLKDENSTTRV